MLTDRYGREVFAPSDFLLEVQQGKMPGLSVFVVRGHNPDVDSGQREDLIPWGGLMQFPAAAVAMEVLSSGAADTAAGTGARTVALDLLDAAWLPVSQTVTLNGTTPVAIPGGPYRRVNRARVASAGTGEANTGTITIRVTAGAVIQEQILPTEGQSRSGVYTVPAGFAAYVMFGSFGLKRPSTDNADMGIIARYPLTGVRVLGEEYSMSGAGTSMFTYPGSRTRIVGPADVILTCSLPSSNNNNVMGNLALLLEDLP